MDELVWRFRLAELRFPPTRVMGVLNVTPDSFSDGGRFTDPEIAVDHGVAMAEAGADVIDVGGESTRPGAEPVSAAEEWRRIDPVVRGLVRKVRVPISVDTRKPEVATHALDVGASIVNDVTGLTDPRMRSLVAERKCGAVIMHMKGEPRTMRDLAVYDDVVAEVRAFLARQVENAVAAGIERDRLVVDPGIGFAKRPEHNVTILRNLSEFGTIGRPVLVGASRKSFLRALAGDAVAHAEGSIAAALFAVLHGASIVRVHDVPQTVRALRVLEALRT